MHRDLRHCLYANYPWEQPDFLCTEATGSEFQSYRALVSSMAVGGCSHGSAAGAGSDALQTPGSRTCRPARPQEAPRTGGGVEFQMSQRWRPTNSAEPKNAILVSPVDGSRYHEASQ